MKHHFNFIVFNLTQKLTFFSTFYLERIITFNYNYILSRFSDCQSCKLEIDLITSQINNRIWKKSNPGPSAFWTSGCAAQGCGSCSEPSPCFASPPSFSTQSRSSKKTKTFLILSCKDMKTTFSCMLKLKTEKTNCFQKTV